MDVFSNREIATIIWIGLILIIFLFEKQVRTSFLNVIKSGMKKNYLDISSFIYFISHDLYISFTT
jgi:hypothetical protein